MLTRLAVAIALLTSGLAQNQGSSPPPPRSTAAERFLLNPDRPFVYLSFDHIGVGERFSQDEPSTRIWLRLVNNCQLPIKVRTFGVPHGTAAGEIGVLHDVVEDHPILTISADVVPKSNADQKINRGKVPSGYQAELSSATTIASGKDLVFSIPTNHIGDHWHIEIPIQFDLPPSHSLRDEAIGGETSIRISYSEWDLPPSVRPSLPKGQ